MKWFPFLLNTFTYYSYYFDEKMIKKMLFHYKSTLYFEKFYKLLLHIAIQFQWVPFKRRHMSKLNVLWWNLIKICVHDLYRYKQKPICFIISEAHNYEKKNVLIPHCSTISVCAFKVVKTCLTQRKRPRNVNLKLKWMSCDSNWIRKKCNYVYINCININVSFSQNV